MATCSVVCFISAWGWSPVECVAGRRDMACTFVNEVVDVEARIIQRLFGQDMVIRRCLDVFHSRRWIYMKDTVSPPSLSFILKMFYGHINQILHIVDLHYHWGKFYTLSFDSSPRAVFLNIGDVTKKTIKRITAK